MEVQSVTVGIFRLDRESYCLQKKKKTISGKRNLDKNSSIKNV